VPAPEPALVPALELAPAAVAAASIPFVDKVVHAVRRLPFEVGFEESVAPEAGVGVGVEVEREFGLPVVGSGRRTFDLFEQGLKPAFELAFGDR
jgi:hypothetical protein